MSLSNKSRSTLFAYLHDDIQKRDWSSSANSNALDTITRDGQHVIV